VAEPVPDAMSIEMSGDGLAVSQRAQRELLEAELETSLALARAQLSLIRGSLATAAEYLARPS
jgi:hypothetical protein